MPAMDYDRVAELYDAYVTTDLDVGFFLAQAKKAGGAVLELMAGTGRVSIPLLQAGVDLTCVDSSTAMLGVLRRKLLDKGLSAELVQQDVCALSLGRRFDLIFIPFHSFAEISELGHQQHALQCIRDHLSENGRFICTLHNPAIRLKVVDKQRRPLGEFPLPQGQGMLALSTVERYDANARLVTGTQFYEIRDDQGHIVSKDAVDIRFYVHDRDSFERVAQIAGYAAQELYGDYACSPFEREESPFMIWILCKKHR